MEGSSSSAPDIAIPLCGTHSEDEADAEWCRTNPHWNSNHDKYEAAVAALDPSLGNMMVSLSHPFALNEPIHYMTWGLQAGIVTAIYLPGEGYNPSDGLETLYLISRPHASPLLVPAHLMRKIPLGASLNPIQEPADTASATAWKLEYTTEEDDEDDRACFSQDWLTQQIEDSDLQMIDHWGPHAVELLVADPQHRVARHHIHTTLIHFSDHRLLVFRMYVGCT
jgi:hypothetical protein